MNNGIFAFVQFLLQVLMAYVFEVLLELGRKSAANMGGGGELRKRKDFSGHPLQNRRK